MPLQTYNQYFGQAQSPAEGFRKGLLTGEGIKNRQFQNALAKDQNERAKAQEGRAVEAHERGKVEDSQADQDRAMKDLTAKFGAIRTDTAENFVEDLKNNVRPLGEGIVAALGDTTDSGKLIMAMKSLVAKVFPQGPSGPADMKAAEEVAKYFMLLQRQFGVEKKSDYKEGETRTFKNKNREEVTEEYRSGKWEEKATSPMDKPEDKEDLKIRSMNAKANLMLAQAALRKANKGIELEPKDIEILEGWLVDLEKKKDGIGWSVKKLTKEEKAMELEIKQVLRKFPSQFLGAKAPQEGIALPPEILNGLVQGQPKGVKFPDGTIHKLMLDQNGQPVEVQ